MLGEVEACLSADGAVAEEGRARAEVLIRTQRGSSLGEGNKCNYLTKFNLAIIEVFFFVY